MVSTEERKPKLVIVQTHLRARDHGCPQEEIVWVGDNSYGIIPAYSRLPIVVGELTLDPTQRHALVASTACE